MNGDFADGLSGWTVLSDVGSTPGGFRPNQCFFPDQRPCFEDLTGVGFVGSNVLVSSMHTVLPGEALSIGIVSNSRFVVGNPDTMHYLPFPPNPQRSQARIDVYDAGSPGFPSALSLQSSVFSATDIQAVPFLGSLIGDAGFVDLNNRNGVPKVSFDLAPYVGKTVYFAYRSSNNERFGSYSVILEDFVISC